MAARTVGNARTARAAGKRLRLLRFLADRGATIRCIGDPHQLASIEAGGADIDMAATAPDATLTLTHVVRFNSSAEATASLQLREGDPTALGWYLDNGRIHSGHEGAVHDDAFVAWTADHLAGRDTIMLAATHDVVTELNARARADRLARTGNPVGAQSMLCDGLAASIGDTIRTRRNNPKLRLGERDWVRNGYTWTVTAVHNDGSLTAIRHKPGPRLGHSVRLPPTTLPSTCASGTRQRPIPRKESPPKPATSRSPDVNHCNSFTSQSPAESTPTTSTSRPPWTVQKAHSGPNQRSIHAPPSRFCCASSVAMVRKSRRNSMLRKALDPHRRIGRALDIYLDSIGVAAENALGLEGLERLDVDAEAMLAHLTDCPAYPVLRQHLAVIALSGRDPITELRTAKNARELDTADDVAAVLDWRLDPTGAHSTGHGPLPWAAGIPDGLRSEHDTTQLAARARIVTDLADQIHTDAAVWTPATVPRWARRLPGTDRQLVQDLAVWRASLHIDDRDLRPTGPLRHTVLEREQQQQLETRLTDILGDAHLPANRWAPVVKRVAPRVVTDPWWPTIAANIETAHHAGIDIETRLTDAARTRPLPDEMPAAALWSRLELDRSPADAPSADHTNNPSAENPTGRDTTPFPPAEVRTDLVGNEEVLWDPAVEIPSAAPDTDVADHHHLAEEAVEIHHQYVWSTPEDVGFDIDDGMTTWQPDIDFGL